MAFMAIIMGLGLLFYILLGLGILHSACHRTGLKRNPRSTSPRKERMKSASFSASGKPPVEVLGSGFQVVG